MLWDFGRQATKEWMVRGGQRGAERVRGRGHDHVREIRSGVQRDRT